MRDEKETFDLVGDRFGKVDPFPLLVVVDVAQAKVVLLGDVQLLAHVVEQILGLASRLQVKYV